ncbi:aminopeptidase P family protein [Shimia marina]|uniref:Putative peptidase n=1 Tax=Shimia marina TaxID=321267 RepID=A0A0P1ES26_9RHOB|nr:aminopeptidase P family protein [Shimia marina]CUH52917.1 putative peptidase [Shimia marina]SFD90157.1 Xaa-Pro aminopeptidase [Shimia marina]
MFQDFEVTARPEQGPARLKALRSKLSEAGVDGFLVPRADAHQGEYVAPRDDRLAWLTGFTGSAGFCVVLQDKAGVFVDGRYRTQVKEQVADCYTPVDWPDVLPGPWIVKHLGAGTVGFDPWLYTIGQLEALQQAVVGTGIEFIPMANPVDAIWEDQPAPPMAPVKAHPTSVAGEAHGDKRARLAADLHAKGETGAVITLPDSIAWLLNIRGADIPRNPLAHGFAILNADASVDLFMAESKLEAVKEHLGGAVRVHSPDAFISHLAQLDGVVRLDKASAPIAVQAAVAKSDAQMSYGQDPCVMPKARKNAAEIAGMAEAHLRDGAAVTSFLSWFETQDKTALTEIDVVKKLEECRRATNALLDISFETIAGTGPNGAIMHYRVTEETNRPLAEGDLMVLDSGGQYADGTTDITRTLSVGDVSDEAKVAFTRVLQGMIAVTRMRFPKGVAGCHIEAIGRLPLWMAGQDFDHGLGHGVGAYLCVHEGPQRLARISDTPLEPGMILSNEPGYYRPGAFGIRLENLIVVEEAPDLPGGDDHRAMLQFRTLTYAPIAREMIVVDMLSPDERDWLNAYHATCRQVLSQRLAPEDKLWLDAATAAL